MIEISQHITYAMFPDVSGESGFLAEGEAAPKKLYTAEHIPSSPGEGALFFPLLSLPHAAAGIPSICREMAHSATVHAGHHCTTGTAQTLHRRATWATSACSSLRPGGIKAHNLMKPFREAYYGPKSQPGTRERKP